MSKVTPKEIGEMIKKLKNGEKIECPDCHKGVVTAPNDPKTSHFFKCDKCKFMINID